MREAMRNGGGARAGGGLGPPSFCGLAHLKKMRKFCIKTATPGKTSPAWQRAGPRYSGEWQRAVDTVEVEQRADHHAAAARGTSGSAPCLM